MLCSLRWTTSNSDWSTADFYNSRLVHTRAIRFDSSLASLSTRIDTFNFFDPHELHFFDDFFIFEIWSRQTRHDNTASGGSTLARWCLQVWPCKYMDWTGGLCRHRTAIACGNDVFHAFCEESKIQVVPIGSRLKNVTGILLLLSNY